MHVHAWSQDDAPPPYIPRPGTSLTTFFERTTLLISHDTTRQEDYRRWVELVYAGDVHDFHGVRLRRYVFSQEDFRNDSAMAPDFYHDNLPTCVRGEEGASLCLSVSIYLSICMYPSHLTPNT